MVVDSQCRQPYDEGKKRGHHASRQEADPPWLVEVEKIDILPHRRTPGDDRIGVGSHCRKTHNPKIDQASVAILHVHCQREQRINPHKRNYAS